MSAKSEKNKQYNSPVGAIFTGIGDLSKRSGKKLNLDGLPSMDGKRVLITGACSGLGLATAIVMAKRGGGCDHGRQKWNA